MECGEPASGDARGLAEPLSSHVLRRLTMSLDHEGSQELETGLGGLVKEPGPPEVGREARLPLSEQGGWDKPLHSSSRRGGQLPCWRTPPGAPSAKSALEGGGEGAAVPPPGSSRVSVCCCCSRVPPLASEQHASTVWEWCRPEAQHGSRGQRPRCGQGFGQGFILFRRS